MTILYLLKKNRFLALILLFLSFSFLQSYGNSTKMFTSSDWGLDFWFTVPPPNVGGDGSSDSLMVTVTSAANSMVYLEISGRDYRDSLQATANGAVVFAVPLNKACLWLKGNDEEAPRDSLWKKSAIHVYSPALLSVKVLVTGGSSGGSFLALPVSALGNKYYVSGYNSNRKDGSYNSAMAACVAAFDNTTIKFYLGGNSNTQTVGGLKPGDTKTYTMAKGDVVFINCDGDGADLTGSFVFGNKPFGVISGNACAEIPAGSGTCSYISEMNLPMHTWGLHYPVAQIPGRSNPSIIRIFAKEKDTKLYRNGTEIATLSKSSYIEGEGWLEMRLTPLGESPSSAVLSGDKPIAVTLYNTGKEEGDNSELKTNPFSCVQQPIEQFRKEIMFTTPGAAEDGLFTANYLNIIYEKDIDPNILYPLEIAKVSNGSLNWEKVDNKYPGEEKEIPVTINEKRYRVRNLGLPATGTYKIRATTSLTACAYGNNDHQSYAHPLSLSLKDLERIYDTIPPKPAYTPTPGEIDDGMVRDLPEDAETRSNLFMVYFNPDSSFNFEFNYEEFIPGIDQTTTWSAYSIDKKEDGRAVITFADRAGNDTTISIDYYGYKVTVSTDLIDFGTVAPGSANTRTFTAKNNSMQYPDHICDYGLKSKNSHFRIDTSTTSLSLQPEETKELWVGFSADSNGTYVDTLYVGCFCRIVYKIGLRAVVGETGVNESRSEINRIAVVPNPAGPDGAVVKIAAGGDCFATITIYNSLGQELLRPFSGPLTAGENVIPLQLSSLAPGMYYLTVNSGGKTERVRFIIF